MCSAIADRIRVSLNQEEGMQNLDKVVLDNARVGGKKFSFQDHEYQIEIIKDTRSRIDVQKCSQVGLSELMVQKVLALSAVLKHKRMMFSLPTKEMAGVFSKDRFDGAIEASEFYTGLLSAGNSSAANKKLGTNWLYVIGTYGDKGAISVPAEYIFSDEVDFSNEAVLGKLNSRLRHAELEDERGNRGVRMRFSTPTLTDYGINKGFKSGDQRYYLCRCSHCEKWVKPSFDEDFVVPGFDDKMINFKPVDLDNPNYLIDKAYLKCPNPQCGGDLWLAMLDPGRRQWVAEFPDTWEHSYQVFPWDVPKYNSPASVIKQMADYPLRSDFYNFVIGLPYNDAENSFTTTDEHKKRYCTLDMWILTQMVSQATVGGMDVGKTCHFTVKTRVGNFWHVIWMEKIVNTKADPAYMKVIQRFDHFRMRKLCIDTGPDITLVNLLVGAREGIQAVQYVNSVSGTLPIVEAQAGDVINADRTACLTLLLEAHNSGDMFYPWNQELSKELFEHFKVVKKIRQRAADGSMKERFIKTSEKAQEHWVHSLNYCHIAGLALTHLGMSTGVGVLPMVGGVTLGSKSESAKDAGQKTGQLLGMFGMSRRR